MPSKKKKIRNNKTKKQNQQKKKKVVILRGIFAKSHAQIKTQNCAKKHFIILSKFSVHESLSQKAHNSWHPSEIPALLRMRTD